MVPATIEDGSVTVAITTNGNSPTLSKFLREKFEASLAGAGNVAEAMAEARETVAGMALPQPRRRAILRQLIESEELWLAAVDSPARTAEVCEEQLARFIQDHM